MTNLPKEPDSRLGRGLLGNLFWRLKAEGRYKLALLVGLVVFFGAGYFTLQHVTFFEPTSFSLTALDRAVGFAPEWIYVYQSLYFLMPLAPLLATRRSPLDRFRRGFLGLTLTGFVIFALFPVMSPRPEGPTGVVAFDLLTRFEGRLNAFPSLHAGLTAYSLGYAHWAFRDEVPDTIRRLLTAVGLLWGAAILYSTLATKQHYAVDVPAGVLLGWLAHHWSRRTLPTSPIRRTEAT